jgi:activator of Hsp90 ATPase-like protein
MTASEETVVRHAIAVDASQEKAFAVFTDGLDTWWPRTHKIGPAALDRAVLEGREGGRWYERDADGSECDWGKVIVWEPPTRVVLAWQISGEWAYDADFLTEVEVTFIPEGPDRTRVEVEHRGLDAYGDRAADMRDEFSSPGGWPGLLEAFAAAVATSEL